MTATARELVLDHQATRLPRQLFWLYLAAPWIALPVLDKGVYGLPLDQILRHLAANYVPFLGIPAAIHAVYAWLMPHLVPHARHAWQKVVLHALTNTLIALLMGTLLFPLHRRFCPEDISLDAFLVVCLVMTSTFMFPTLIVQELRAKAANIERLVQAQRQAALEAQLEAIQARTNPHFFFNSINTVASLIPDDPVLAEQTLLRVADILRYALQSSQTRLVPLGRELDIVRDYLEVQKARFGERLAFELDVDPAALAVSVPPLILQPLVENAVLHGVAQSTRGGRVRVTARCEPGRVRLVVEDDGPGGSSHHGTGTSMNDLERRLSLIYGAEGAMTTGPREDGGWCAALTLPLAAPV